LLAVEDDASGMCVCIGFPSTHGHGGLGWEEKREESEGRPLEPDHLFLLFDLCQVHLVSCHIQLNGS
jgi:hypothetical protein